MEIKNRPSSPQEEGENANSREPFNAGLECWLDLGADWIHPMDQFQRLHFTETGRMGLARSILN